MEKSRSRQRLPKTKRDPAAFAERSLTERDITIITTIARYRFVQSADVVRLVGGNADVTYRHLQQLYHRDLISRTTLPSRTTNPPFIYFLENGPVLRALVATGQVSKGVFDFDEILLNRSKYSARVSAARGDGIGHQLFLAHEAMISRFHAALESESAQRSQDVVLDRWKQGAATWCNIPALGDRNETLPIRPDAYFNLHFPNAPDGERRSHFFYEADRQTSNRSRFKAKLEAYVQFFLRGHYTNKYGTHRVRAVLTETTNRSWLGHLLSVAADLAVREPLAGPLFWFTTSELVRTEGVLETHWTCAADDTERSLLN